MDCKLFCSIAIVFMFAMIYLKLFSNKRQVINEFEKHLSNELQQKYKNIALERRNIYMYGMLFGLIIGLLLLFIIPIKNNINKLCLVLASSFILAIIYYILYPKSDYIILYLNNYDDRKRWLDVYKYMQTNYYIGIIIGIIISIIYKI